MGCAPSSPQSPVAAEKAPLGTIQYTATNPTKAVAAPAAVKKAAVPKRMRKGSVAEEIAAMDDDELTLGVDVSSWLEEIGMQQYFGKFTENGFDDLETVEEMDENDLVEHVGIDKKGHVMKLMKHIAQLKDDKFNPGGTPKTPHLGKNRLMSVDSTGSDEMGGSAKSSSTAPKPAQRFRKGSVAEEIAAMDEMDFDLDDSRSSSSHNSKSTDGKPVVSEELAEGQSSHISRGLGGKKARRASVVAITADEEALLELQAEMAASELAPGSGCDSTTEQHETVNIYDAETFVGLELKDLREIAVLGIGTFSKVTMVQIHGTHAAAGDEVYALKKMKKKVIETRKQTEHVMNEKTIMQEMRGHGFLLQLVTTFKDDNYIYMLLELCQGGELFLRLLEEQVLSENQTRFYAGCVVLALEGLHNSMNIYRDLKPENLLLDTIGYVKIADLGFAKKVKDRTFTRCGTPEYVSPEMLGRMGHNKATDYWSLGIFLYECLHGTTPFAAKNYMSTYKKIAAYAKHPRLKFRASISKEIQLLMKGLMHPRPSQRLGMLAKGAIMPSVTEQAGYAPRDNTPALGGLDDIFQHEWFKQSRWYGSNGPGWDALRNKKTEAPFVPTITSKTDTTYFQPEDGPHVTDAEEGEMYEGTGEWFAEF